MTRVIDEPLTGNDFPAPPLKSRFWVSFGGLTPSPLDLRFQRVSGLTAELKTVSVNEGGENRYTHRLPERVEYANNLLFERGLAVFSAMDVAFDLAMSFLSFNPTTVLVILMNEDPPTPLAAWSFRNAYPVKWSVVDLDANKEEILIETLELAYSIMVPVRI